MSEAGLQLLSLLAGLGFLHALGYGLMVAVSPGPAGFSKLEGLSLGFGLGVLLITLWMLTLSLLGIPFSRAAVVVPPLGLIVAGFLVKKFLVLPSPHPGTESRKPTTENRLQGWDWLFVALLAGLFLFAVPRAVLYPVWAWDAIAVWAFKAKAFSLSSGIDFRGFQAHNYYPVEVPLVLSYLYLWMGQVNDHLVKLLFPWCGGLLLALMYGLLRRMELSRRQALGLTAFFALGGTTFIVHLYIAYADLIFALFTLGVAGLMYLRLRGLAPPGSLPVLALTCAALSWCKFEGPPMAGTILLAAALTLLWLRPPRWRRQLLELAWPLAGILLGVLPWRLFLRLNHIEVGSDHLLAFFPHQFFQAVPALLAGLAQPAMFGFLWWAAAVALVMNPRRVAASPPLFLALFLAGNLLALLLGYALSPCSLQEFPFYIRGTLDRLLLHFAPVAPLLVGEALKETDGGPGT